MNVKQAFGNVGRFIEKNSPHILTGIAITSSISAVIFAVEATPKAVQIIEREKLRTKKEIIEATWKLYIPTGASLIITIASVIGVNAINQKRNAALAGLYSLAQTTFKEYQAKVVETIGEKKELKVRDEVDKDKILSNPSGDVILTGIGDVLCFDSISGRYFTSDIEKIKRTVNELNRELLTAMFVPLNDLYFELGLEGIKLGDDLGFDVDDGLLDIRFSSQLTKEGKPCLVLNYDVYAKNL